MTLSVHAERLLAASTDIRSAVPLSDLTQHVACYRVGNIVGWRGLWALTSAVSAFPEAASAQLNVIANAISLGADDAIRADHATWHAEWATLQAEWANNEGSD